MSIDLAASRCERSAVRTVQKHARRAVKTAAKLARIAAATVERRGKSAARIAAKSVKIVAARTAAAATGTAVSVAQMLPMSVRPANGIAEIAVLTSPTSVQRASGTEGTGANNGLSRPSVIVHMLMPIAIAVTAMTDGTAIAQNVVQNAAMIGNFAATHIATAGVMDAGRNVTAIATRIAA